MEFTSLVQDWKAFVAIYRDYCSKLNRLVFDKLNSVQGTVKMLDKLSNDETVILYVRECGEWKYKFDESKKCYFITITRCPVWSTAGNSAISNVNRPSKLFTKSFNQVKSLIEYKFKIK